MEDTAIEEARDDSRRWLALGLLCTAFFMVVLDVAVVNVALPPIQADLGFSPANLQWVVSAYALTFGGLLLLGGRAADLLGRRRMFVIGVLLFSAASLLGGLAWSEASMIAARAIQGVGAAVMTPAALSLIMTSFKEGAERNKALGVWGAVGASGATFGLIVGGVLADTVGWEWIFLLNVPIGLVTVALAFVLIDESRLSTGARRFDVAGALSVTVGLALLVYAIVDANDAGWGSTQTIGLLAVSGVLLALFVLIELRSATPLLPFRIFRLRALTGSNAAGLMLGGAMFGTFFVITLYLQQVLGFSPLEAGFAWLATSLTALASAMGSQALVTKVGTKRPLAVGLGIAAVGIWLLSRVSAGGSYFPDLALPMIVLGLGMGAAFVSISIGALEGVEENDAGLASGLVNTAQQIGGALGVAVLSTVALSRTDDVLSSSPTTDQAVAVTEGFQSALVVASGLAVLGAVLALVLIRGGGTGSEAPVGVAPMEPALEEGGA
jgi:EmrB/QacA subfamily drug resistance transporter